MSDPTLAHRAREDAFAVIARRIEARIDEVAREMIQRYQAEIVDYATLDAETLADVRGISVDNLRSFLANLERGELLEPNQLERTRQGAARRVHQGISLESYLHAFRLWGQLLWQAVLECARTDRRAEREAALQIARRVLEHVDEVSTAGAQAYVAEAQGVWSDREVMRRDLLDALLAGQADAETLRLEAASLRLHLRDSYVVVLARRSKREDEATRPPLSVRAALRKTVDVAKQRLCPPTGSLLVGVRHGEIVALYPAASPVAVERVKAECAELARTLGGHGFGVGIGGWHPGLGGIPASYSEAREATEFAVFHQVRGQAIAFDEILVAHILRSSQHADRVLADTLGPLRDYDARRRTELIRTLRAFFEAGYNLTRAAEALTVHPNTVVYRLRRIRELTGRDPHDPEDLLLLVLGLKLIGDASPGPFS